MPEASADDPLRMDTDHRRRHCRHPFSCSRGHARPWIVEWFGSASSSSLFVGLLGAVVVHASRRRSRTPAKRRDTVAHAARTPSPAQGAMANCAGWWWLGSRARRSSGRSAGCVVGGGPRRVGRAAGAGRAARTPLRWTRRCRGWRWRRRARAGRLARGRACCRPRRARSDRGQWTRARTRGRGRSRPPGSSSRPASRQPATPRTAATSVSTATLTAFASSRTRGRGIAVEGDADHACAVLLGDGQNGDHGDDGLTEVDASEREFGGVVPGTAARGANVGGGGNRHAHPDGGATAPMSSQAVR